MSPINNYSTASAPAARQTNQAGSGANARPTTENDQRARETITVDADPKSRNEAGADRVSLSIEARALSKAQAVEKNQNDGRTRADTADVRKEVQSQPASENAQAEPRNSNLPLNSVAQYESVAQKPRTNSFQAIA